MSKLIFTYGTMGSAKTANALMQYFELKNNKKKVLLLKPETDTRDGTLIKSRIGLQENAIIIKKDSSITEWFFNCLYKMKTIVIPDVLIIDEVQFLSERQVTELKDLACRFKTKIYCYGLKTDFTSHLFPGSKRLLELADEVRKLDMQCIQCDNDAEINARINLEGKIVTTGDQVEIGSNDKYKALCYKCWKDEVDNELCK